MIRVRRYGIIEPIFDLDLKEMTGAKPEDLCHQMDLDSSYSEDQKTIQILSKKFNFLLGQALHSLVSVS
jgi:hypothetical protein